MCLEKDAVWRRSIFIQRSRAQLSVLPPNAQTGLCWPRNSFCLYICWQCHCWELCDTHDRFCRIIILFSFYLSDSGSACSESGIFSYSIAKYANIFLWFQQNLMSKDHLPFSPLLRQTALEQEYCPAERGILGHRYTYNDKTLHLVFAIWQLPLESCRTEHLLKQKNHEK